MNIIIVLGSFHKIEINKNKILFDNSPTYDRLIESLLLYYVLEGENIIICSGEEIAKEMRQFLIDQQINPYRVFVEKYSKNLFESCIFCYNLIKHLISSEVTPGHLNGNIFDNSTEINFNNLNLYIITNDYQSLRCEKVFTYFLPRLGKNLYLEIVSLESEKKHSDLETRIEKQIVNRLEERLRFYKSKYPN